MKKIMIGILALTSLSTFAGTIKVSANGYGDNDQVACKKAKKEAFIALEKKCGNQNLGKVEFSKCRFVTEGEYYVVYTVDAQAQCISKN